MNIVAALERPPKTKSTYCDLIKSHGKFRQFKSKDASESPRL